MAQHIDISKMTQKVFKKISEAIHKDFRSMYVGGSLKYRKLRNIVGSQWLKTNDVPDNIEIYMTNRYIGKGFVWGTARGDFEIHFDKKKKRVRKIYLVA